MLPQEVRKFVKEKLSVTSDNDIDDILLTDGRSGAEVYRIKVCSRKERLSGNYIVKICDVEENEEDTEAYKAKLLYEHAPLFTKHLVKVAAEKKIDKKSIILYHQANDSVWDTVAFSGLDGAHITEYMEQVSHDLLSLMNEKVETGGTAEDFFRCLLEKQLGLDGRFESRIKSLLERPEAESIALNGEIFPNPLYIMKNVSCWGKNLTNQIFLRGIVHGDLHGYNLLASDDTYSVIDYDSVSTNSYLFFDQAYFELSIFYDVSKDNDLKGWNIMLERLIKPSFLKDVEPCENYKEYIVRNAICRGITIWMNEKKLEKIKEDIEIQFMMARIAAGINFFCKRSCVEKGNQVKVLLYISYCIKILMEKIDYNYNENDISTLCGLPEFDDIENLWEGFVKFTNYVPVLITDDNYSQEESEQLKSLCGMDWQMIIDIGLEQKDLYIYKNFLVNCKVRSIKKINIMAGEKVDTFSRILNFLSVRKKIDCSYQGLWRNYGKYVIEALKSLSDENPRVPLVFLFDCGKDSLPFKNQLINNLCDLALPASTRIVSLQVPFAKDLKEEIVELESSKRWHFLELIGANLMHTAQTCRVYLNKAENIEYSANLPSINGICTFNERDLISIGSCIELVYSGCEYIHKDMLIHNGLDMSGGGDSLGEAFYKGNEATWSDIARHRDLGLMEEVKYNRLISKLSKLLDDKSPRVKTRILRHGAGAGGTTLSKRILWDFKEQYPCARLKKYTVQTPNILLEIYQKTGKCILLTVESGSTVISDEELNILKKAVDAENGRLVILLIKRISNDDSVDKDEKKDVLETLGDTMPIHIAKIFRDNFAEYAMKKENGQERKALLEKITGNDNYKEQRSPFFYGFYTFQKEYRMFESLQRTVSDCNNQQRTLLNNMALVTRFSQNICVSFLELQFFLDELNTGIAENIYILLEKLPSAIFKLTSIRDKGLRLCHKVIAEKILLILHDPEGKTNTIDDVVFKATKEYIQSMREMYSNESEYVDNILKELIIDRAYIDSEQRKTRFSELVETISLWTNRKALFEFLIQEFPNNPHYYNHLARLLARGDKQNGILPYYEEAEKMAEMAIKIANIAKATHETTLGCIYGQWIINDIDEEKKNKRKGRLSSKYSELITNINVHYKLGKRQFDTAREHIDAYDSFSFFPQINMECEIIRHMISFDLDRNLDRLFREEPEFREWYDEHFSIAMELFLMMKEKLGDDAPFSAAARNKLDEIARDPGANINKRFVQLLNSNLPADRRRRRSLAYTVFSINGCNWNKVERETLRLAELCFRQNIMEQDEEHRNSDIETWFELYRRVINFKPSEAQSLIADYMEDGYRKDYLLYLLTFIMRKEGIASASEESIVHHISEAKRIARSCGLNTAREHDAYVGNNGGLCPIVPIACVDRDEDGEPTGLEEFTGIVIEVEQTHGKILLDKLNLDVTFIPKPLSVGEDMERIFSREDIGCAVKFNVVFSYSGLRGWKVVKI